MSQTRVREPGSPFRRLFHWISDLSENRRCGAIAMQ